MILKKYTSDLLNSKTINEGIFDNFKTYNVYVSTSYGKTFFKNFDKNVKIELPFNSVSDKATNEKNIKKLVETAKKN